jgi:hypothetical protein
MENKRIKVENEVLKRKYKQDRESRTVTSSIKSIEFRVESQVGAAIQDQVDQVANLFPEVSCTKNAQRVETVRTLRRMWPTRSLTEGVRETQAESLCSRSECGLSNNCSPL